MSKKTRYFLTGSSLVLALGLCTGLVAYYNGGLPGFGTSRIGPEDLAYVPSDASAVAYAKVGEIMNSEFSQKLRQMVPTGEAKNQLLNETGIDIDHDIDSVTVGFSGIEIGSGPKGAIALVRGRFNAERIEALVRQHGGAVEEYQGKKFLIMNSSSPYSHPETGCVAFIEPGLLALGEVANIKRAIDAHASGENVTKNSEAMALVGDIAGNNNAWVISRFDTITRAAASKLPSQASDQLASIQWFTVSAHVDGGVNGVVRAEARDDQAAENLRDVIRGGLAAARLVVGKDDKASLVLDSLQLTGTGKTIGITFRVTPDLLDLLSNVAQLKQHLNPGR